MTGATRRPTLIPRWLIAVLVAALLVAALMAALSVLRVPVAVSTPSVVGLDGPVARSRLAEHGLSLEYGDTRFSGDVPLGAVIEQDPAAGSLVDPGTTVTLVISAGSESFQMPDIVGLSVEAGRDLLEPRGVSVTVEVATSDQSAGTIIETVPAAGFEIGTGTGVRLVVAGAAGSDVLLPTDLAGAVVLIDPDPPVPGEIDVTMEIARHVRALLQASGAEVLVTRSIIETQSPPAVRAAWAAEASPTVTVGIGAGDIAAGSRAVYTLPSSPERAAFYLASVDFARSLVEELSATGQSVSLGLPAEDPVLDAAMSPGARLLVGPTVDPENVEVFADPAWSDEVGRALYRAIVSLIAG